ncbi:transglutaminase TgpA family protein [Jatrophihabitans fulvus]
MSAPSVVRARTGWALVLLLLGAFGFVAGFRGVLPPLLLAVACSLPFGIVRLGQKLRLGTAVPALVCVVLAALGAWLALRSDGRGVGDALPRLLTTARPADPSAALLAAPLLLVVLVATVVAAAVLADPRHTAAPDDIARTADGRFAGLLAPVLGAALLYGAAQLLAAGAADPYGVVAVCLLAVVVAGWTYPYARGGRAAWRPLAVLPLVLAIAVGLGAAALTSTSDRFDPREHVTPPTVQFRQTSPLTQLRAWAANPDVRILRADVTGTDRLRLAVLDTFTGASWQVDSRYRELGLGAARLPAGARQQDVRATVRLERLGGLQLPTPGTATGSSLPDVLGDPDDGSLALPGEVRPGLTYSVSGRVDAPTRQELSVAAVPPAVPPVYLDLANAPIGFAQYARNAVRGASTPLEEAVALENAVASGRRVDPKAASGSSFGRLSTFLFAKRGTAGAAVGSAEQFAAAFAVLGREVGLPTRLVVGFELDGTGTVVVRGRDATVWPEVYLDGPGWTRFSPTPGAGGDGPGDGLRDQVLKRVSERAKDLPPLPPPASTAPKGTTTQPSASATRQQPGAPDGLPGWVVAVLVVGGVLVLLVGAVAVLRARRTRRHRRLGARGAWSELEDLLVLVGRAPGRDRPAPEVAADAADLLGERGAVIAAAADREAFAPAPGPSAPVWGHLRTVRRDCVRTLPRYRRPLSRVDPRPLLRR